MTCREIIMSEEYADFIINYNANTELFMEEYQGQCPTPIGLSFGTIFEPLAEVTPISLSQYEYESIPKLYGKLDTSAVEATGALELQNYPGLNLRGSGCIICIIDDGIDPYHTAFRFSDGTTRLLRIWDQTNQSLNPPRTQKYGSELTREQINEELKKDVSSLLDNVRANSAHGTFLAGVAAGSANETVGFQSPAPLADLVVVKLKPAKQYLREYYLIQEEADAFQENDILNALIYVRELSATFNRPVILCLGLGTSQGPHNGSSLIADILNNAAGKQGIGIVVANGNEGNARHHYTGRINGIEERVEIRVGENQKGFVAELWGESPDIFSIGIVSPGGEVIERVPAKLGATYDFRFILENTRVTIDYRIVERRTGSELIQIRMEQPSAGIWQIVVYGDNILNGNFNIWLPITEFIGVENYFLRPEPFTTLTSPADAAVPISVGGYDVLTDALYIDSSRGFTTLNAIKPDLIAPAVEVFGPAGAQSYARRSGTSVAAALTAGVVAQFMEWGIVNENRRRMNTAEVKNYLIRGANRQTGVAYPNRSEGFGQLDVFGAFEVLRNS